jgi:single-strand DNA-binding protein
LNSLKKNGKKYKYKIMVNKVILIGHLGKDPESKTFDSGKTVCNFSIATSEKWKDNEETTWHNIVIWGALAEIAQKYLKKGSKVYIEGKITNRSYEDKEGKTRYVTEIVAREMKFLGGKDNAQGAVTGESLATVNTSTGEIVDDLPF